MKTISLSVSADDYEAFRRAAKAQRRSIAQLIRDAMRSYREAQIEARTPLRKIRVFHGHRVVEPLPSRAEVYEEMLGRKPLE